MLLSLFSPLAIIPLPLAQCSMLPYALCPPAANAVHLAGSTLRFDMPFGLLSPLSLFHLFSPLLLAPCSLPLARSQSENLTFALPLRV